MIKNSCNGALINIKKFRDFLKKDQIEKLDSLSDKNGFRKTAFISIDGDDLKYLNFIRRFIYSKRYVPVNAIEGLDYYMSCKAHNNDKKEILKDCHAVMLNCSELWVFSKIDVNSSPSMLSKLPEGVLAEIFTWFKANKKPVKFFTWKDVGIPKYTKKDWKILEAGLNDGN